MSPFETGLARICMQEAAKLELQNVDELIKAARNVTLKVRNTNKSLDVLMAI